MKALIAGINGFVGQHLTSELLAGGYEVEGLDVVATEPHVRVVDLLDKDAVRQAVAEMAPDCIFHLAAQASVSRSWADPQLTFDINVKGTLNLLDAIRAAGRPVRIIIIGSSEQYGIVRPEDCPIKETLRSDPQSPYAISKQAQESLVQAYVKAYGLDIIMTRSFNHAGPGQRRGFALADFASQIADIEKGAEPVLQVGNLEAKRDFTDVRDVVRAYRLLNESGQAGEIYNVGSGQVYRMRELLDLMVGMARVPIEIRNDPERMRPSDLPLIQSDNTKLRQHTGWEPHYSMEQTITDTLDYWRSK